jgi:Bacterial Ig-like domain
VGVSYDAGTLTATLTPTASLDAGTSYRVTVKGGPSGAKDVAGNALAADVSWTFTTGSAANLPPTATIDGPASSVTWKVGDAVSFSGHATDPEQGTLGAAALAWTLILHHCPSTCHTHTLQSWQGVTGGSFNAPDHEYPSHLELRLTATDSGGLTSSASVQLNPVTVVLNFASAPSGLQVSVNGSSTATPFSRTVIVGSTNSVSATSPQAVGGTTYTFQNWSDAGAQTHDIVAPASTATYTAAYTASPTPPANTVVPSIAGIAREGQQLTLSNGTWTGATPMTFTYQWLRCASNGGSCAPISGAETNAYVLTAADVGSRVRGRVTASNAGGSSSVTSEAVGPVKRAR